MSNEKILIKRYDSHIDRDVSRLRNERKENANLWNEFKTAFTTYEGTAFSYLSFKTFLNHDDPKAFLIDRYVKNQKLGGIPVKPDKLEEILDIPDYQHLLVYKEKVKDWVESTMDEYYDKKKKSFVPPPVTNAEKERIIEKHSIYANNEEEVNYVRDLKGFCNTINYLQRRGGISQFPSFLQTIKPISRKLIKFPIGENHKYGFKVNYRNVFPM